MESSSSDLVRLEGIYADYGPRAVLRDVSLSVQSGDLLALVGHNGAGKTTALRIASGLKRQTSGEVELFGEDVRRKSATARARMGLGLVPEGVQGIFPALTVEQNLRASLDPEAFETGLDDWLIEAFSDVLVDRRSQVAGSMSGGQRQMLAISIALARKPNVLMLDEPSTGLAPRIAQEIFEVAAELVRERNIAIIAVEHELTSILEIATDVCVLGSGQVVARFPASDCPPPTELWRLF